RLRLLRCIGEHDRAHGCPAELDGCIPVEGSWSRDSSSSDLYAAIGHGNDQDAIGFPFEAEAHWRKPTPANTDVTGSRASDGDGASASGGKFEYLRARLPLYAEPHGVEVGPDTCARRSAHVSFLVHGYGGGRLRGRSTATRTLVRGLDRGIREGSRS